MDDFLTDPTIDVVMDSYNDLPAVPATDSLMDSGDWTGVTDLGLQSDFDLDPLHDLTLDSESLLSSMSDPVADLGDGVDYSLFSPDDVQAADISALDVAESAEPKFGISISAGQTDSGDARIWSTANNAGGGYYNARTGQPTK